MRTKIIEKERESSPISTMLTNLMTAQFQTTLAQFEKVSLLPSAPLNKMMSAQFVSPTENPHLKMTECEKIAEIKPSPTTSLAQLQTQNSTSGQKPFADIIQRASQTHGVPVALIDAVIKQESAYNPLAKSCAGAEGLMQLMPQTGKSYGCTNPFDPEQNVMAGTEFLKDLLTRYQGNIELTLAGYNAGPGNVAKYGNTIPPFAETKNYVQKVMNNYQTNLLNATEAYAQNSTREIISG